MKTIQCTHPPTHNNLDKVDKEQQRIKQEKLSNFSGNSSLTKRFLSNLMNIFLTFSLRETFYPIATLSVWNLKISILSSHEIKHIKTTRK